MGSGNGVGAEVGADLTALYREDATEEEMLTVYQHLIDTGEAWRLEGHVGRTAHGLIESGLCVLGEEGHRDYYGSYVPSRYEVEPGTMGSIEFALADSGEEVN